MPSVGDSATIVFVVTDDATAIALRSGDVPVLGTPRVVALCEEAAVRAIGDSLPAGSTTVGTHISIDHTTPTAVGRSVSAMAVVTLVGERVIEFDVSVNDDGAVVAAGHHVRAIVDRGRFVSRLES